MRGLWAAAVVGLACAAEPVASAGPRGFDLAGDWYVLATYHEPGQSDPAATAREDAVWRFERDGGRLRWTLFASPIHEDEGGGIDLGTGPLTAAQAEEMADRLVVTRRNTVEKALEGSDAAGWRSRASGVPASATALTFERDLRIDGLPDHPVFVRVETLGGVGAEDLAGTVRFVTREVESDRLAGDYERDGALVGGFAMWRIGPVRLRE